MKDSFEWNNVTSESKTVWSSDEMKV